MKTTFLSAVLVVASAMTWAKGPGQPGIAVIKQQESGIYKVIYAGESVGRVTMTILNKQNEIVYEEARTLDGFVRRVNFAGMAPGEYTIEITDRKGSQSRKILHGIKDSTIQDFSVLKMTDEGKYLLAITNSAPEDVQLEIYDGAKNLVHSQNLNVDGQKKVVYNLKAVTGIPTFEITDQSGKVRSIARK